MLSSGLWTVAEFYHRYFIDQPLTQTGVTDKHLLLWHFEDWLKKYFYGILQILETLSLDPLPYVRMQAMGLIFTLLCEKPEQEQNLLRLLVNKMVCYTISSA